MPRTRRIEYPGAIYHIMNRGDRRENIFVDEVDRQDFLRTLAEACQKTGWQAHAYCLMNNHFHLVVETPNANLVAGMRWFLSAYTIRLNHRQKLFGHVFSGRKRVSPAQSHVRFENPCKYQSEQPARNHSLRTTLIATWACALHDAQPTLSAQKRVKTIAWSGFSTLNHVAVRPFFRSQRIEGLSVYRDAPRGIF